METIASEFGRPSVTAGELETGRSLAIENNGLPSSMIEALALAEWLEANRKSVEIFGDCFEGCKPSNRCESRTGQVICKHTLQPCKQTEMAPLLEVFGLINGKATDGDGNKRDERGTMGGV